MDPAPHHALSLRQSRGSRVLTCSRYLLSALACLALAGCGDPIADIPRLSEQNLPEEAPTVEIAAAATPDGGSLVERLLNDSENAQEGSSASAAQTPSQPSQPRKSGFLALFSRMESASDAAVTETIEDTQPVKVALSSSEGTSERESASLPVTPDPQANQRHNGFSLFGGGSAKPKAAAVSEIAPGTVLPYGKVARICGLSKSQMGKKVAQFPERRPKHNIYDSEPGNTTPHSFFITGFDDGCARQFTASLAMFGSVAMHEQLRYGLPAEVQPYSDTDKAYEMVKSRVCGVPRKKPCGAKLSRLERNTVFVSIYERFGSNSRWKNLLLHDGEMLADDTKGG